MMNKPIVRNDGEWLFPIAVWAKNILAGDVKSSVETDRKAFVYLSNDAGDSFHRLGGVDAPQRSFDEHMVVELDENTLAMYIRTHYGIAVSYSYDGGNTWTEATDSGWGGPNSRFHVKKLQSGRLLLINHYRFSKRNNLTAMLSEDNGKTWKYKLLLDERKEVSYPDAVEGNDGYIYIVYDRERGAYKHSIEEAYACAREILLAKITEQDILEGKLTDRGSRLKMVVSRLGKYADEKNNPYHEIPRYSDTEMCKMLYDRDDEDILTVLFENYEINCMNMCRIDSQEMDRLIDCLRNGIGDRYDTLYALVRLIRNASIYDAEDVPIVSAVKKIIKDGMERNITLDEIASSMNMSKYYLCHIFKKTTNMTLTDWKNYLRIEQAKELLENSDLKIIDIALLCGLNNASYFSEIFLRSEKITPDTYREMRKKTRTP